MQMPGFNAETSLGAARGTYRGRARADQTHNGGVSMQLDDSRYDRLKAFRLKAWDSIVKDHGPEIGEQTCDSGAADCSKGCTSALNTEYNACKAVEGDDERLQCYTDAVARASACQTNCASSFPSTPVCPELGW